MRSFVLRIAVLACLLSATGGGVARAAAESAELHPTAAPLKEELVRLIEAQLAAFRADDFRKAYSFAAAEVRGAVHVEGFKAMVLRGYPVIAKSRSAFFGLALDSGNEAVINVRLQGPEDQTVEYRYLLKREGGSWRIGGVVEVRPTLSV